MIEHQLLRSSTDDSKPEPGRASPSDPRPPRGKPGSHCRSPPPALSARDSLPDRRNSLPLTSAGVSTRLLDSRCPLQPPAQLRLLSTSLLPPAPRRSPGTSTTPPAASGPRPRSPPCAAGCSPRRTAADTTGSARCRAGTAASPSASSTIIHRTRRLPALLIPCSRRLPRCRTASASSRPGSPARGGCGSDASRRTPAPAATRRSRRSP